MRWVKLVLVVALPLLLSASAIPLSAVGIIQTEAGSDGVMPVRLSQSPTQPRDHLPAVRVGVALSVSAHPVGHRADRQVHPGGIPYVAFAAYQRAAAIVNEADPTCSVDWELLAAIGRVESDHGRVNGGRLGSDGIARPAILGPRLNGKHDTKAIRDTDAGTLDHDKRWDRAVGPMQFIPSTWALVAVDANADGKRDPQDIADAALAAAVLLCSSTSGSLSDADARNAAVFGYNHDQQYVDLVLRVAAAYAHRQPPSSMGVELPVANFIDVSAVATRPVRVHPPRDRVAKTHAGAAGDTAKQGKKGTKGTKKKEPTKPGKATKPEQKGTTPKAKKPAQSPNQPGVRDDTPAAGPDTPICPTPIADPADPVEGSTPVPEPTEGSTPAPEPTEGPTPALEPIEGSEPGVSDDCVPPPCTDPSPGTTTDKTPPRDAETPAVQCEAGSALRSKP